MIIEEIILKNIGSFNNYDESSKKYLDDGPRKYDSIIQLLALQKEYQQKINELNQLNHNFNQGIPMDQIRKYQRKGILMSVDGSKRTCVNNPGVCSSNNSESQIKFEDFFDPSVRHILDKFGSSATTNKITPFYTKDSVECSNMCQDDTKCGMWLYGDIDSGINSLNRQLEQGSKYNDINKSFVIDHEINSELSKHGGGVLGYLKMMFGESPIGIHLGDIKKGTQIVKGNCFNIPTTKVGDNIKCSQSNSVIGNTMFDFAKVNKVIDKVYGIDKSILTPETIKYSSGYCDGTTNIDKKQKEILEKSAKNFAPIRKKMMKNKNEYIKLRNEKENELLYLSLEMNGLLNESSDTIASAKLNIESSKNQLEKIGKTQEEIDSNVISFNNNARDYERKIVQGKAKENESISNTFKYTFWLTLFICFAILIIKPNLLSKPVSYALMGTFSLYVLSKVYHPLLDIIASVYKLLKKILWSNNNI